MNDQVKALAQTSHTGTAATVVQRMTGGQRVSPVAVPRHFRTPATEDRELPDASEEYIRGGTRD